MIKANSTPTMVMVEAEGVVFSNNHVKVNRRLKASEVKDDEATKEEEDPHMDVETPRMSNATTAKSLDIMPRIVSRTTPLGHGGGSATPGVPFFF
jgi:hypothetical protein